MGEALATRVVVRQYRDSSAAAMNFNNPDAADFS
jgi:hypothetical protein